MCLLNNEQFYSIPFYDLFLISSPLFFPSVQITTCSVNKGAKTMLTQLLYHFLLFQQVRATVVTSSMLNNIVEAMM